MSALTNTVFKRFASFSIANRKFALSKFADSRSDNSHFGVIEWQSDIPDLGILFLGNGEWGNFSDEFWNTGLSIKYAALSGSKIADFTLDEDKLGLDIKNLNTMVRLLLLQME